MLILVGVVGVATLAVGVVSYQSTESRLMTEIDRSLGQATNRLSDIPGRNRPGRQGDSDDLFIPERPLGIEQYVVQISDTNGNILAATIGVELPLMTLQVDSKGDPRPTYETLIATDGTTYRVRAESFPVGIVQLGRDLSEVDNVLSDLRTRTLLIGLVVAAVAALLGWLIAFGMTSRLRKLSLAAEQVATTGRLEVNTSTKGRDESARLARSFKQMLDTLARSKEQQQRLVEDAGHELRTPLTSLRTNLDVMKRHPDMDDALRDQILSDINRDAADLAALVEEVVALAADRYTDELPQPLEIRSVVSSIAERAARRSGREVVVVGSESIVLARHHMFDRAVSNLIDNALKFDVSGGRIEVLVGEGSVTVADRGPGVPEAELSLIFERFHRSVASRTLPGSGLGLSIVADVAQTHGGKVFARNRTGGGAEIGFSLPTAHKSV